MSKTIKRPVNIDMCGGELQNFKFQNLTTTPASPAAGMPYYDSTNNIPKYYDGTSFKEFGRVYSQSTGITIANDNSISVTDYAKLVKNTATGTNSLTLLGTAANQDTSVNIGVGSSGAQYGVALGNNATTSANSTALGYNAKTTAAKSIQIGSGTNITASTMYVGFDGTNYQLLDGTTGKIPDDRLSTNVLMTSSKGVANGLAELDASGKVPSSQLPAFVDDVVEVLTFSVAEPDECSTGDKYFNTTSNKIFTATGTDTWGTTGTDPTKDVIYVRIDTNASYRWSGSAMINIANPIGAATESEAGIAEIATNGEITAGADDTRIVTPLKLNTYYQRKLSAGTGITFVGNSITVTNYSKFLQNNATGTGSLCIAGYASSGLYNVAVGYNSLIPDNKHYNVAIGYNSSIGVSGQYSTAIGTNASVYGPSAIQIGYGANEIGNTLYVGFYNSGTPKNWKLLSGSTGLIPDERISSTIKNGAAAGATAVQKFAVNNTALTASGGGVTWSITNSLGTKDVQVAVYEISSGEQIFPAVTVAQSSPYGITIEMLSSSNITADTYRAVVMG